MKTQDEIVQRLRDNIKTDLFGFASNDYLSALDYEHAREFLKPEATAETWDGCHTLKTDDDVKKAMRDYMEFAWEKANDKRGISAGRSMSHYAAWLWLIGEDLLSESTEEYQAYGKPQLVRICAYLGLDASKWDDGDRADS